MNIFKRPFGTRVRNSSSPPTYKFELIAKIHDRDVLVNENFDFSRYEQYMSDVITKAKKNYMALSRNDPRFWLQVRISENDKVVDFAWHDTPEDYKEFLSSIFSEKKDLIYDFWEQGTEFYIYRRNGNIEIENCDGEFKHNVEYTLKIPEQTFLNEMSKIREYFKRFSDICQKFPKMGQANLFYYHPRG